MTYIFTHNKINMEYWTSIIAQMIILNIYLIYNKYIKYYLKCNYFNFCKSISVLTSIDYDRKLQ